MAESCDICGREGPVDLFSSGCAPITYAGCPECRVRGAEELGVAGLWYLLEGGGAAAEALLSRLTVWEEGAYVGADRVRAYVERNRDRLLAEMNATYELIDLPEEPGGEGKI